MTDAELLEQAAALMERHLTASTRALVVVGKIHRAETDLLALVHRFPEYPPQAAQEELALRFAHVWDEFRETTQIYSDINLEIMNLLGQAILRRESAS